MHVVIHPLFQLFVVVFERLPHWFAIYHDVEGEQEENDENGWDAVTPDVDTFIV